MLRCLFYEHIEYVVEVVVLPLLLQAIENDSSSISEIEVIDSILQLLDRLTMNTTTTATTAIPSTSTTSSFLEYSRGTLFAAISLLPPKKALAIGKLLQEHSIYIPLPQQYILDEEPSVYMKVLSRLEGFSVSNVLEGSLLNSLQICSKSLGIAISDNSSSSSSGNGSSNSLFSSLTYHLILLPIIWKIGSNLTTSESIIQLLHILSTQTTMNVWKINKRLDSHNLTTERINIVTADILQNDFLYILSNLLLKEWSVQSSAYHQQAIRCLQVLITLLNQSDLVKFLPKVSDGFYSFLLGLYRVFCSCYWVLLFYSGLWSFLYIIVVYNVIFILLYYIMLTIYLHLYIYCISYI